MLKAKDVGVPSMHHLVHLNSLKHRWNLIGVGKITKKIVREVIMNTVVKNRPGPNFYLLKDKNHIFWQHQKWMVRMDSQEMQRASLISFNKLSVAYVNKLLVKVFLKSAQRYSRRFMKRVNKEEGKVEVQKLKTNTGMVSSLIHKRVKQIDPRIAWLMLKKFSIMCCNINNKEESNADMLLKIMSE